MDSHASMWPLELELWTPTLRCGPSTCGDALPSFDVAPRVGAMDWASVHPSYHWHLATILGTNEEWLRKPGRLGRNHRWLRGLCRLKEQSEMAA